jgi:cell division protein FtsW (lipid II flippase)
MMKKILIIVVTLAYGGFLISTAKFATLGDKLHSDVVISSFALIVVNLFCAWYLHKKAKKSKTEWALFGSVGNVTAVICFWLFKDVLINWRRGKRNFSPDR